MDPEFWDVQGALSTQLDELTALVNGTVGLTDAPALLALVDSMRAHVDQANLIVDQVLWCEARKECINLTNQAKAHIVQARKDQLAFQRAVRADWRARTIAKADSKALQAKRVEVRSTLNTMIASLKRTIGNIKAAF